MLDDPRLSSRVRDIVRDKSNALSVSAASGWETVIKVGTGKLKNLPILTADGIFSQYGVEVIW